MLKNYTLILRELGLRELADLLLYCPGPGLELGSSCSHLHITGKLVPVSISMVSRTALLRACWLAREQYMNRRPSSRPQISRIHETVSANMTFL